MNTSSTNTLDVSDVISDARDGKIDHINASGQHLDVFLKHDTRAYESRVGPNGDIVVLLLGAGVKVGGSDADSVRVHYRAGVSSGLVTIVSFALILVGMIVFAALLYFVVRNGVREAVKRANVERAGGPA